MSGKEQGGAIPATRTASREMSRFLERVKLITVAAASLVNSESALAEPKLLVTRPCDIADSEAVVSDAVTSTNLGKRTSESQAATRRGNCRILHIRCTPILSTLKKKASAETEAAQKVTLET